MNKNIVTIYHNILLPLNETNQKSAARSGHPTDPIIAL